MGIELARAFITIRADQSKLARDFQGVKAKATGMATGIASSVRGIMAGMGVATGVAAIGAAFFAASKEAVGFEKAMIDVRANARLLGIEGEASFQKLNKIARKLGETTQFTAIEAAKALNQLVLGGVTAEEAVGAVPSVLNLAASASIGLAQAAKIVVDNMRKYGMEAKDTGKIADFLSSAQSRAQITAIDLAGGLQSLGSIAAAMNVEFRDVVAIMTGMGRSGTEMNRAGTSLAMALARLSRQPADVKKALKELNIEMSKFVTPEGTLDLIGALKAIAVALPVGVIQRGAKAMEIFGARGREILGVLNLMAKGEFVEKTAKGLEEDLGRAATVAAAKMDTFWGSLKKVRSALGEMFIAVATPILKIVIEPLIDRMRSLIVLVSPIGKQIGIVMSEIKRFFTEGFGRVILLGAGVVASILAIKVALVVLSAALSTAFVIATGPLGIYMALFAALGAVIVEVTGEGATFGEKMNDVFSNKIPALIEGVSFAFRNFGDIAQLAMVDLTQTVLDIFPNMEKPIEQTASFFIGVWEGARAFFGAIIQNMIGGLLELKNMMVAIWAGMAAAWKSLESRNFRGIGTAFADAFIETLANQKDVLAPNAFVELGKGFAKGREEALEGFKVSGDLGNMLEDRRQALLDSIAKREQKRLADIEKTRKKVAEEIKIPEIKAPKIPPPKIPKPMEPVIEGRFGLVDFGKQIQDALLKGDKDKVQKDQLKELENGNEIGKDQIAAIKEINTGALS